MDKTANVAEVQYSSEYRRVEIVVPHGTKSAQLAKLHAALFTDFIKRLPRGCLACLSGEPFIIRERLEHVLRVDLDAMKILEH